MKVPIDDYACINLDAPTLPAYEISFIISFGLKWRSGRNANLAAPMRVAWKKRIRKLDSRKSHS